MKFEPFLTYCRTVGPLKGNIGICPGIVVFYVKVFHVYFDDFLPAWRSLAPKFGFYAKFHRQNRLEMSGKLHENSKTSIFRFLRALNGLLKWSAL